MYLATTKVGHLQLPRLIASDTTNGSYQGYVDITTTNGFKFTNVPNWNGTSYGDVATNGESGVLSTSGNNLQYSSGWLVFPAGKYNGIYLDGHGNHQLEPDR